MINRLPPILRFLIVVLVLSLVGQSSSIAANESGAEPENFKLKFEGYLAKLKSSKRCSCHSGFPRTHPQIEGEKVVVKACPARIISSQMYDLEDRWVAADPEGVLDYLLKIEHPSDSIRMLAARLWGFYAQKDYVTLRKKWDFLAGRSSQWLAEAGLYPVGRAVAKSNPKEFVHKFIPRWGLRVGSIIEGYWHYAELEPEAAIQAIRIIVDPDVKEIARYGVGRGCAGRDLKAAYDWALSFKDEEMRGALTGVFTAQLIKDPAGAAKSFAGVPKETWRKMDYFPLKSALDEFVTYDPVNAARWAEANLDTDEFNLLNRLTWKPGPSNVPMIWTGPFDRLEREIYRFNENPFQWTIETCVTVLDILWEKDQDRQICEIIQDWCDNDIGGSLEKLRMLPDSNGRAFLQERLESLLASKQTAQSK